MQVPVPVAQQRGVGGGHVAVITPPGKEHDVGQLHIHNLRPGHTQGLLPWLPGHSRAVSQLVQQTLHVRSGAQSRSRPCDAGTRCAGCGCSSPLPAAVCCKAAWCLTQHDAPQLPCPARGVFSSCECIIPGSLPEQPPACPPSAAASRQQPLAQLGGAASIELGCAPPPPSQTDGNHAAHQTRGSDITFPG